MTPALLLATGNRDKAREMAELLAGLPLTLKTRADFDALPDVEETADTFAGNALLKAEALSEATGLMALGDDSGLCVDALEGAPGLYSARYAGPDCTYQDNNQKLLAALANVPAAQRTATFVCVVAVVVPGRTPVTFEGRCDGVIADGLSGGEGFGYDPLFYVPEQGQTFARMPAATKAAISHRAQAFALARQWLAREVLA